MYLNIIKWFQLINFLKKCIRLLRPALVETNPVPLNSDVGFLFLFLKFQFFNNFVSLTLKKAFSSFNDFDPNKQRDNRHVKEATERLYDEGVNSKKKTFLICFFKIFFVLLLLFIVIPAFAADLEMRYGSDHRPHSTDV